MIESQRISEISRCPDESMATYETKSAEEVYLRDQDICCGRGKGASKHPGNQVFHNIIQFKAEEFSKCSKKLDKSRIIAAIVHELLLYGVRFLKRDSSGDKWIVLAEGLAREKTGHAIRDHLVTKSKKEGKNVAKKVIKEKAESTKTFRQVDSFDVEDDTHQHDSRYPPNLFNTPLSRRDLLPILSLPISLELPLNYRKEHGIFDTTLDLILTQDQSRPRSPQKLSVDEILEVCAELLSETNEEDEEPEWDDLTVQKSFAEAESILPEDWL